MVPKVFTSLIRTFWHLRRCEEKTELCHFFRFWLELVAIIKNAVVSEREENWNRHVASIEDSMPECECINYLLYGSWYLE